MSAKVQLISAQDVSAPAGALAEFIDNELGADRKVLWMLSGGSALEIAKAAKDKLKTHVVQNKLHVALIDERFGPVGHEDSNWQQLVNSGFNFGCVTPHPILVNNDSVSQTTSSYAQTLAKLLQEVDTVVGLFGIGVDGHTAGILPNSSIIDSKSLVDHYKASNFTRITITPRMFSSFAWAVVYANGEAKLAALQQFNTEGSSKAVPARFIKQAQRVTLYTDVKGVAK